MNLRAYVHLSLGAAVVSALVTLGSIVAAVAVSPTFRWSGHALSNLGQPGSPVATPLTTAFFDGGLVLGGILGLGFAVALWLHTVSTGHRLVVPLFLLMMVSLIGIGVFPQSQPEHFPAAVGFFVFSMLAKAVDGTARILHGNRRLGAASLLLLGAHIGVWWAWSTGGPIVRDGLAIPELLGSLLIVTWIVMLVVTIRNNSTTQGMARSPANSP